MSNYYYLGNGVFASEEALYHYGVPGMKWGVRKKSYASEKSAYKSAKKNLREANRDFSRNAYGIGIKGIGRATYYQKKRDAAELKALDAKAKYKSAKSKNSEKAEFKTYRKAMQKTGLVGSAADTSSGGKSTRLYNHLKTTKGKKYADRVQKQVQNVAYTELAVAATVAVGSAFVSTYLANR